MSMNKRDLTDFYEKDVPAYASYDNLRKIANVCDGLKISQRKLVWSAYKRCFNEFLKTESFANYAAVDQAYVHGAGNLVAVINGLVAPFVGANNYPLLVGNTGGFGNRIIPRAAAGRYTRCKMSDICKVLFKQIDNEILDKQYFEAQWIEPRYLVPIFPVLFLNGSEGLSTGFSQSIYPRNPVEVIEYIKKKLAGTAKPRMQLLPWFKGHLGKVVKNEDTGVVESFGVITKNNMTSYTITEIPIGIEYQKYITILDKLCDNGTIQDYTDKCDPKTDKILFEIKTSREFTRKHEAERKLLEAFKLVKGLPEVLTCITESNKVKEYSCIQDILDDFIEIRLKYYNLRKQHILDVIQRNLDMLQSKWLFCEGIIKKTIHVANVKKDDIIKQLEKVKGIKQIDGSYDYLLHIPIYQVTKEKIEELKKQIEDLKAEQKKTEATSINDMWLADLAEFKKAL